MSELTISLDGVSKFYGEFAAVKDLSFSVRKGEIYGFLGQNGAGKTTTLRMLMDIVPPSSGKLSVLGASRPRQVKARVGYLPEERGLYRKMKAADSIAYFARLKGTPAGVAKKRAEALLERFGLGEFARSKIEALSKGMAQKVQLLSVIAHEPELLVLDEPFSGLDPVNQQTLEDMILELRAGGRTIVFSTHVMAHAERLCDRFLMIAKGEKVFEGTLAEARAAEGAWLILVTPSDPAPLARLPEIKTMQTRGGNRYALKLAEGADSQKILRVCLENGIEIVSFGAEEASLHELFFRFVGAAPEATAIRQEAA